MRAHSFSHVSDRDLLRQLASLAVQERTTTAELIACIAEVDARRPYLPAGYPSMHAYCVNQLRLSEDAASKRIQAARIARELPAIFAALAQGQLHLTGVGLLAPHLRKGGADELLKASAHKTKAEIEVLLAARFPSSETLGMVVAIPASGPASRDPHAPAHVEAQASDRVGPWTPHAPAHVESRAPGTKVTPIAAQRFELRVSIGQRL